jgi:hypothetical protein
MKYFLLKVHEAFTPPRLENWFGKLDANGAKFTSTREVFMLSDSQNMIFTDVILHPCLMVSEEAKKVIEMYEPYLLFQRIILLNRKKKVSSSYYLPLLRESHPAALQSQNAQALIKTVIDTKVQIFIRLDLVESMLRRKMVGIGLQEIFFE